MTAWWLTDNRRLDHLAYDDELVALAGVDASKLPPLVPTGSVIGHVRDDVAAELGLPAGVQVVTGVPTSTPPSSAPVRCIRARPTWP